MGIKRGGKDSTAGNQQCKGTRRAKTKRKRGTGGFEAARLVAGARRPQYDVSGDSSALFYWDAASCLGNPRPTPATVDAPIGVSRTARFDSKLTDQAAGGFVGLSCRWCGVEELSEEKEIIASLPARLSASRHGPCVDSVSTSLHHLDMSNPSHKE
ncbi:hypothetical protein BKA81DRAFT_203504 [Phyllosticta paracitricarpa]